MVDGRPIPLKGKDILDMLKLKLIPDWDFQIILKRHCLQIDSSLLQFKNFDWSSLWELKKKEKKYLKNKNYVIYNVIYEDWTLNRRPTTCFSDLKDKCLPFPNCFILKTVSMPWKFTHCDIVSFSDDQFWLYLPNI